MANLNAYEMVIGIETHVELKTETKIFCGCSTKFGAPPNTQCCPVCAGMPGTLPVLNRTVVDYAVTAGLATHCQITRRSKNDRKNYFYPDLPKDYQISQYDLPLCEHGYVAITGAEGEKRVGITRIHIEEDAGKLVHGANGTQIDLNRCGVPLIEIVSEPDMRSVDEALAYLKKLRAIILYTGISDVKMNEGSFRADINLSVRKKGAEAFGTRTETKNLNSFAFIAKAIEYEFARQVEAVEAGEKIVQETRRFDTATGKTYSMRTKEDANDYRYFPDPDLQPIELSERHIEALRAALPALPDDRKAVYMDRYGLSAYHSEQLVMDKAVSDFFEAAAAETQFPQVLANLLLGEVQRLAGGEETAFPVAPGALAAIADLLGGEELNSTSAKKLLGEVWISGGDPRELADAMDLKQINDPARLAAVADQVLAENPAMAADYRAGKTQAQKALMGKAMGKTGGRANPVLLDELLQKRLDAEP